MRGSTVYLSVMLVNTTISEIENTINKYDDALNVRFDPEDYIRVIEVTDVNVTSVRLSKEKRFAQYVDSLIVVFVNETESKPDDLEWQHSVMRYWQDPTSLWIKSEYLFDTGKEERVFYESVEVFDNWAIGYKDNIFTVIFYETARADLVLNNYHVKAYEQAGADVAGFSYFDQSGQGSWDLIILVQYSGSIVVTPVQMIISPTNYNVRFTESTSSNTFLRASTVAS